MTEHSTEKARRPEIKQNKENTMSHPKGQGNEDGTFTPLDPNAENVLSGSRCPACSHHHPDSTCECGCEYDSAFCGACGWLDCECSE